MALTIDILLIFILVGCIFWGWKKGFVKSMSSFLCYTVAFALANGINKFFAPYVRKLPFLSNMITEGVTIPEFEPNATFFDKLKVLFSYLTNDMMQDGNADASKALLKNWLAEMLSVAIAFAVIFAVVWLLMKLLFFVLDKSIQKIPFINKANGFLGAVAGLLNGFIWTWFAAMIFINIVIPVLHYINPDLFLLEVSDSFVLTFCTKINPIKYLFWLINFFS